MLKGRKIKAKTVGKKRETDTQIDSRFFPGGLEIN